MMRIVAVLFVALVVGVGCLPTTFTRPSDTKAPVISYRSEEAIPVVLPEGITDQNAWERAKSLKDELERESRSKK